jgi:cysteine desulfurase
MGNPVGSTARPQPPAPAGFLDAASGEPLHPAGRAALLAALDEGWADPARLYGAGRRARLALDRAREQVAAALGCRPDEVGFAGSGTEAVHRGVAGLALGRRRVGTHLVASAVEHSCVLHAAELLVAAGGRSTLVGVDQAGVVDDAAFAAALAPGTALACLQSANHEVGTTQPVEAVAAACAEQGVPLLVDAAASVGRGPLPGGWSALTASAAKWGGPAGVGVLSVRTGVRWRSPGPADSRAVSGPGALDAPGRPDVPAVVAAAAALEAVVTAAPVEDARLRGLTDRIRATVAATVPDCEVLGHPTDRLPHIVTFSCLYASGEALLLELDRAGFAVTSGSSCSSSTLEPSHVLVAMGALAQGNVRVSLPHGVDPADVDRFLQVLPGAVQRVRAEAVR